MKVIVCVDSNTQEVNPGPCAIGAIAFAAEGQAEGRELARSGRFIGTTTNNVGEWRAVIEGLAFALTIEGVEAITIRTDSQLVQKQIVGRWKVKAAHLRLLLDEWQAAAKVCPCPVTVEWVSGDDNPAHDVTNEYLTPENTGIGGNGGTTLDDPPFVAGWRGTITEKALNLPLSAVGKLEIMVVGSVFMGNVRSAAGWVIGVVGGFLQDTGVMKFHYVFEGAEVVGDAVGRATIKDGRMTATLETFMGGVMAVEHRIDLRKLRRTSELTHAEVFGPSKPVSQPSKIALPSKARSN